MVDGRLPMWILVVVKEVPLDVKLLMEDFETLASGQAHHPIIL